MSNYEGHIDKFELPANVYRINASTMEVNIVANSLVRPNGLCFSPDEKLLYIVDTGQPEGVPQPIKVFDVIKGKELSNGRLFCEMGNGWSDGIRCDIDENVWAAASGGGEGYDGYTYLRRMEN